MTAVLDDFGKLAKQKYVDTVEAYNAQVVAAKSVSSKEEFEQSWYATDPMFAEEREKIEKLESALESVKAAMLLKGTPNLEAAYTAAVAASGVDLTALDEQLKLIRTTAKYITSIYGDEALEDTPEVERRAKSGGSTGGTTGGRRIRGFDIYIDGVLAAMKNAKGEVKSTFSVAAKELGVETTALQRAFFEAAGSEDVRADNFPTVVEFEFNDKNIRAVKVDDSDEE